MKKFLISGVALATLLAAGAASAADLPSRRAAPPAYIPPVFTWTGFYAGVNAGYAFNGSSSLKDVSLSDGVYTIAPTDYPYYHKNDDGGFTGGAQIGYNYQMGSVVLGIEADFNYIDLEKKVYGEDAFSTLGARSKTEWFGTVRPRLGFTPVDRLMLFVTGGLAYGQVKTSAAYNEVDGYWLADSKSDTRVGWTVGAGAEYAITNNLIVKGEYAYVDLGDKTRRWADEYATLSVKDKTDFHIVRAGLNYKF